MPTTVSEQLRNIAGTLRAYVEEGEFDDIDHDVLVDIEKLPAALERIAKQAEG